MSLLYFFFFYTFLISVYVVLLNLNAINFHFIKKGAPPPHHYYFTDPVHEALDHQRRVAPHATILVQLQLRNVHRLMKPIWRVNHRKRLRC